MATKAARIVGGNSQVELGGSVAYRFPVGHLEKVPPGTIKVEWSGLGGGDDGAWVMIPQYGDKCVHVSGTVTDLDIEGSNEVGADGLPTNPFIVHDPTVAAEVTFTAGGGKQILEAPQFIRPKAIASTDAKVTIIGRKMKMASGG